MPSNQAQEFLFQRIRQMLPPAASLTDTVSDILHLSQDSAYRRIRNETPLVLDEAAALCDHFCLSIDQVLHAKSNAILFQDTRINHQHYSYEAYLSGLLALVRQIDGAKEKEIIYLTKDIPLFHNFYFKPLVAFRYFFWMKTILQDPAFSNRGVDLNAVPASVASMSASLADAYLTIPSTEIWNTECVNSIISQVEFYKDAGLFSSAADIRAVYDAVAETVLHLKSQVEHGNKFLPGFGAQTGRNNFNFFYNRVVLGNNTILVNADGMRTVYLNYDVLNYMVTRDGNFCNECEADLRNLMRKATVISQTSEKQRNIFFGILLAKIDDRRTNI
jgi:hypothetical protein